MAHRRAVSACLLLVVATARADWRYESETDEMTGKKVTYGHVDSFNLLDLERPYAGANYGHLTVRQRGSETTVFVVIDKGQFVGCVIDCPINVRFDDKPPVHFTGKGPADYSSKVAFILPAGKFINMAKAAKVIRVQANIFQAGAPVLEFRAAELKWPPLK